MAQKTEIVINQEELSIFYYYNKFQLGTSAKSLYAYKFWHIDNQNLYEAENHLDGDLIHKIYYRNKTINK